MLGTVEMSSVTFDPENKCPIWEEHQTKSEDLGSSSNCSPKKPATLSKLLNL